MTTAPKRKRVPARRGKASIWRWLEAAGVKKGERTLSSKATLRSLCLPQAFPADVNMLGVLLAQTHQYESELAVVMRKLKKGEDTANNKNLVRVYPPERPGDSPCCTEILTMFGLAQKIRAAAIEAWDAAGVTPSAEQLKAIDCGEDGGLSRQHVRRSVQKLEDCGVVERARLECLPRQLAGLSYDKAVEMRLLTPLSCLDEGEKKRLGSRTGHKVGIFLLARPKSAKPEVLNVANDGYINSANFPVINADFREIRELMPFLSRADRPLAPAIFAHPDFVSALNAFTVAKNEVQQIVDRLVAIQHEAAKSGESKASHAADDPLDQAASPHEAAPGHPPALQPAGSSPTPSPAASPVPTPSAAVNSQRAEKPEATPAGQADRTRTSTSSTAADSPVEVSIVQATMRTYCHPVHVEQDMARALLMACRKRAPSCRIETVVDMIHRKGTMMHTYGPSGRDTGLNIQKFPNPPAFLRTAVPKMFDGDDWKQIEKEQTQAAEAAIDQTAELIRFCRDILADNKSSERDRELAREKLGELGLT